MIELSSSSSSAEAIAQRFLAGPTAKQRILTSAFRSPDNRFQAVCRHLTIEECDGGTRDANAVCCQDIHFEPVMYAQTDVSLGHCSYLNTCHRTDRCKYLHFRPVRRTDAEPFVWRSTYADNPMPVRASSSTFISTSEQRNVHGNLFGQTAGHDIYDDASANADRSYVETPIRHPVRALQAYKLHRWWARNVDQHPLVPPAQWIDADLNALDFGVLGKFDVILADPPWDIHMSLPYVTMTDNSMRAMRLPVLQDEGFLFLWVTSRAMELGRECMALWGYRRIDEIVWVKVGQTQRLIRTGRTGHWLNHTKEHCLVGVKRKKTTSAHHLSSTLAPSSPAGNTIAAAAAAAAASSTVTVSPLTSLSNTFNASHAPGVPAVKLLPDWANAGLDTDVIVAEVRDTSRKPDELYTIIERLCPNGKKIELFGRRHNARPGWLTVGNQLKGDRIVDQELKRRVDDWRQSSAAIVQ